MVQKIGFMKKQEIEFLLKNKPHLQPVYEHVLDIPRRVHEYDPELFIVFNKSNGRWELHSLDGGETTYNATINYKTLDDRAMRQIRKNDIRAHGMKIYERIQKSEEKHEKQKKKEEKEFIRDFGTEFRGQFAKDAWL